MALAVVTVTGIIAPPLNSGFNSASVSGGGSFKSRGDPHGSAGRARLAKENKARGLPAEPLDLNTIEPTPAEQLPVVTVETARGPDDNTSVKLPDGSRLTPAPNYPGGPRIVPVGPQQGFLGPVPEPLPEVKVQTQRPPVVKPPTITFTPNPLGGLRGLFSTFNPFWLLFASNPTGPAGRENKAAREAQERELTDRLLPISPSVERLLEPIAEVTVTSSTGPRPGSARAENPFRSSPSPGIRPIGLDWVQQPASRLKPKPQRGTKPKPGAGTYGVTLLDPYAPPLPSPPGRHLPSPVRPGLSPLFPLNPLPLAPRPSVPAPARPLPSMPPVGDIAPDSFFQPQPFATPQRPPTDNCRCTKTTKKPQKKRKPRTECRRGTYVQHARGISYSPKEKIPCR